MRLTEQQLQELLRAGTVRVAGETVRTVGQRAPATCPPNEPPRANKYRAERTVGTGPTGAPRCYDSKAEASFAEQLNQRVAAGELVSWVPQVSLPTGVDERQNDVRYRADALLVLELFPDGSFRGRLADRKGVDTPTSRAKRAALRATTGLDVEVVTA